MDFYDILKEHGMTELLSRAELELPKFKNTDSVEKVLKQIRIKQSRVFLIGDYDVDGLMCNMVLKDGLRLLGIRNVVVFPYRLRMHSLDPVAVQQCIQGGYEYCIIADCGSNNLGLLKRLTQYGVTVILLDHHETSLTYEDYEKVDGLYVINTMLEPAKYDLSAGALCYCVLARLCKQLCVDESGLSVYALISLYADCMGMRSKLNRAIYYRAMDVSSDDFPRCISMFMNQYQTLSARFINFWFSPRINALFRTEALEYINQLFLYDDMMTADVASVLQKVESLYEQAREMVLRVADVIQVIELNNIVIADLMSVDGCVSVTENRLWNYTGLVANKLSDRYAKAAFVYCNNGDGVKGSVRDIFGRDFLTLFSQLCRAEGHNAAFGTHIQLFDMDRFIDNLTRLDKRISLSSVSNKPIVIQYRYAMPDDSLIEDIALVNEFSGTGIPVVLLKKQRIGAMREIKTDYNYKYPWGNYYLQSQYSILFGSWVLLRPTKGIRTKLIAQ